MPNLPNYIQTPIANPGPYAHMGYVGSLQLRGLPGFTTPIAIRVTSCDIHASQEITFPEVVDGRIDNTLYQIAPMIVGGNVAFPLTHEDVILGCNTNFAAINNSMASTLWAIAALRDVIGRMYYTFAADIRYTDNTAFTYPGCMINTFTFTINQGEPVSITAEIFGGAGPVGIPASQLRSPYSSAAIMEPTFLSPARVVTWNDAQVEVWGDGTNPAILSGNELREFTATIDNKLERIYSLNSTLGPQDIVPKKRDIKGSLKIMGMNAALDTMAFSNQFNYTSGDGFGLTPATTASAIAFGYSLGTYGAGAVPYWATAFFGVIFKLETMALATGIFETTCDWQATGDCNRDFLATALGASTQLVYPQAIPGGGYGAETVVPGFPEFTNGGNLN